MSHTPPATDTVFRVERDEAGTRVRLSGKPGLRDLPAFEKDLAALPATGMVVFDLTGAEQVDSSVAWSLIETRRRIEAAGGQTRIEGGDGPVGEFIEMVADSIPTPEIDTPPPRALRHIVEEIGENVALAFAGFGKFVDLLGLFVARTVEALFRPSEFRFTALVHHAAAVGVQAVPIVALMSFLIGVVLAFQGSAQLRQFGAEVFVVDLIAISILRELGILLTAIIVAGRTASSFTAAIGSMKMREEIDAMRTLGIDPGHALVVPRVLALVLMLPILGLIANIAGLFGGGLMSWIELGISPAMFTTRLVEGTSVSHVFVGLSKAPVFAVLIGVIGCRAGLSVGSTAESLGQRTSGAVVAAIFAVILADALFSIFFQQVGI